MEIKIKTIKISCKEGRQELVKFLSSTNDSELHWSYAQVIFQAGFADQGNLNKDATMARWS